jgi:hypothetical protein
MRHTNFSYAVALYASGPIWGLMRRWSRAGVTETHSTAFTSTIPARRGILPWPLIWRAAAKNLRVAANKLITLTPGLPDEAKDAMGAFDDVAAPTDFRATNFGIETADKQKLPKESDVAQPVALAAIHP